MCAYTCTYHCEEIVPVDGIFNLQSTSKNEILTALILHIYKSNRKAIEIWIHLVEIERKFTPSLRFHRQGTNKLRSFNSNLACIRLGKMYLCLFSSFHRSMKFNVHCGTLKFVPSLQHCIHISRFVTFTSFALLSWYMHMNYLGRGACMH